MPFGSAQVKGDCMKDRYRKDGAPTPPAKSRMPLIAAVLFLSAFLLAAAVWIVYSACKSCSEPTEIIQVAASVPTVSPTVSATPTSSPVPPSAAPTPTPLPYASDVSAGDEIPFGHYELDNDPYYEPEPIPWIVLDRQPGKILVLSKYALNSKAYQTYETERPNITWEQCELRAWLNHDFLSKAFDADEQRLILTETVPADVNPAFRTVDPGNDTEDRVFLLSAAEVLRYFPSPAARLCFPTEYARECGADTDDADGRCWWWLRSPGHSQTSAAIVSKFDGEIATNYIGMDNVGIRPAMWLACPEG